MRSALRRQPAIRAFGQAPQETQEWAGNPGFSRIRSRLRTPGSPNLRWKSPKVSALVREYSHFAETIGGDWFDHDCRPTYFVRPWQVLELAPLLFCWAAEMSLRERRERLKKLEEACKAARTLENEMPHLPPANLVCSEEKIAAESRSIDAHDIFGMCFSDDDFSEGLPHSLGDDTDNPFAIFLAKNP